MTRVLLIFTILFFAVAAFPNAAIFSGNDVKILKNNLDMNSSVKILSGSADPTSSATSAPVGSLYMNNSNGNIYKKNDSGSSTNWTKIATGAQAGLNLVENPDFEVNANDWSASGGTFTRTTTAANVLFGVGSGEWTPSGAQTLTETATTVPVGLYAQNCEVSLYYKDGETGKYTLEAYDGSGVLASVSLPAATTSRKASVPFVCPSTGSVSLRISASASATAIHIDDARLAQLSNVATVAQPTVVASAYIAQTASCLWNNTNTSEAAFSAQTACPGPTSEYVADGVTVSTTDTDLPKFTLNNLRAGTYVVTATFSGSNTNNSALSGYTISDGTTTSGHSGIENNGSGANNVYNVKVVGVFQYTTAQASKTFEMFGRATSATTARIVNENNTSRELKIVVVKYPSDGQLAVKPENSPTYWSGYHDSDCGGWTTTSGTLADPSDDASCTFTERVNKNFGTVSSYGSKKPGITFTPNTPGAYYVCATTAWRNGTVDTNGSFELSTTGSYVLSKATTTEPRASNDNQIVLCGIVEATSTSAITVRIRIATSGGTLSLNSSSGTTLEWSVVPISAGINMFLVDNVVTSGANSSVQLASALLNCDGSSAITSQIGSPVSAIGNISSGDCSVTLASGVFSSSPYCQLTEKATSANQIMGVNVTSATALTISCETNAGTACTAFDAYLTCHGPR